MNQEKGRKCTLPNPDGSTKTVIESCDRMCKKCTQARKALIRRARAMGLRDAVISNMLSEAYDGTLKVIGRNQQGATVALEVIEGAYCTTVADPNHPPYSASLSRTHRFWTH